MNDRSNGGVGHLLLAAAACLVLIFLLAPQVVLLVQSFTAETYLSFPPRSFGLRWYAFVAGDETWRRAIVTSLLVASVSTPLALLLGGAAALALDRGPARGRGALKGALISPMVLPHVVLGLSLYRVFLAIALDDTFTGFVAAHLLLSLPYVVVTVGASLQTFDLAQEEAARSLGASPARAFRYVTLPAIMPGVLAGMIFAFVTSFDEFIVTFFLASRKVTIPIQIFGSLSYQIEPSIAAMSGYTMLITVALSAVLVVKGHFGSNKEALHG